MTKSAKRAQSKRSDCDKAQSERFIEAARELGCDEDTSAADALMGWMARTPPQPRTSQPKALQEKEKGVAKEEPKDE